MISTILLLLTINQLPGPQYSYDDLLRSSGTNQWWYNGDPSPTPTSTPESTQTPGTFNTPNVTPIEYRHWDSVIEALREDTESSYSVTFTGRKYRRINIPVDYKCLPRKLGGAVCIRKRK